MDWRNKNSEGGSKPQSLFNPRSKNNEGTNENKFFRNKKGDGRFKDDTSSEEKKRFVPKYNNNKSNGRFDNNKQRFENTDEVIEKSSTFFSKSSKPKKFNNNLQKPKVIYKSYEDIDKVLNSGKYISANKRSELESLRAKLKEEYDKEHPDINNEEMFPSLTSTTVELEKPKTCWGQKLPSEIYDTTVPFTRAPQNQSKTDTKVNSDISDEHEFDSFDDDDDYYNEYEDDDEEYYNGGY